MYMYNICVPFSHMFFPPKADIYCDHKMNPTIRCRSYLSRLHVLHEELATCEICTWKQPTPTWPRGWIQNMDSIALVVTHTLYIIIFIYIYIHISLFLYRDRHSDIDMCEYVIYICIYVIYQDLKMSMDVFKKCMWIKNGYRIHGYSMMLEEREIYILDIYTKTYMEKSTDIQHISAVSTAKAIISNLDPPPLGLVG